MLPIPSVVCKTWHILPMFLKSLQLIHDSILIVKDLSFTELNNLKPKCAFSSLLPSSMLLPRSSKHQLIGRCAIHVHLHIYVHLQASFVTQIGSYYTDGSELCIFHFIVSIS